MVNWIINGDIVLEIVKEMKSLFVKYTYKSHLYIYLYLIEDA